MSTSLKTEFRLAFTEWKGNIFYHHTEIVGMFSDLSACAVDSHSFFSRMKCTAAFLVLSMLVLMAEPGECIWGALIHGGTVCFPYIMF